jgi:hypothetical protein
VCRRTHGDCTHSPCVQHCSLTLRMHIAILS